MLAEITRRITRPIRRPIDGLRSFLVGLPVAQLRDLMASPVELKNLAQLQWSFFNFRYLLPVLLARKLGVFAALEHAPLRLEQLADTCELNPEAARTSSGTHNSSASPPRNQITIRLREKLTACAPPGSPVP